MSEQFKICFLADRHSLFDDRIYWKMAVPLKQQGHIVHYLLIGEKNASGLTKEGINYKQFKLKTFSTNRYINFLIKRLNPNNNYRKLYEEASFLKADIYHFHDLWINRIGGRLKNLSHNPVVFYDAREPYAEDYISYSQQESGFNFVVKLFANWVDQWEKNKARKLNMVIANEETVQRKFDKVMENDKTATLYNYSDQHESYQNIPYGDKEYDLIYCGGITELRGAFSILNAVLIAREKIPQIKILFLGSYFPHQLKQEMQDFILENKLVDNVELRNQVNYQKVSYYYNKSRIGLVLLHPVKTYKISMPIKIFEYMTFGLPIIGSNFGHIEKYISQENCGIAVDPENTDVIAGAMVELLSDTHKYNRFSNNGRKAAMAKYKWDIEFKKLLGFYKRAINGR